MNLKNIFIRLLTNKESDDNIIYDRAMINTADKDYEFIPMPEGWLCIITTVHGQTTSCHIPDPDHSLRFKFVKHTELESMSPPLSELGTFLK